jgi:WD40 repeat protein
MRKRLFYIYLLVKLTVSPLCAMDSDTTMSFHDLTPYPEYYANSVDFSKEGDLATAAYRSNLVKIWDPNGYSDPKTEIEVSSDRAFFGPGVYEALYCPTDPNQIAIFLSNGDAAVYDVRTGKKTVDIVLKPCNGEKRITWHPAKKTLACSYGSGITEFEMGSNSSRRTKLFAENVENLDYNQDGSIVCGTFKRRNRFLWEKLTDEQIDEQIKEVEYDGKWLTFALKRVPNKNDHVVIGALFGDVHLIKIGQSSKKCEVVKTFEGHTDCVGSLAFNPKKPTLLVSGSRDKKILFWDIESEDNNSINSLLAPDEVNSIAFHPSGKMLAASCNHLDRKHESGIVRIWDLSRALAE